MREWRILHISDLLFGSAEREKPRPALTGSKRNWANLTISLFVGNITFSGSDSQFDLAERGLTSLATTVLRESPSSIQSRVLVVPGKRDVGEWRAGSFPPFSATVL